LITCALIGSSGSLGLAETLTVGDELRLAVAHQRRHESERDLGAQKFGMAA